MRKAFRLNGTDTLCVAVVALSVAVNAYELHKHSAGAAILAGLAIETVRNSYHHEPTQTPEAAAADQKAVDDLIKQDADAESAPFDPQSAELIAWPHSDASLIVAAKLQPQFEWVKLPVNPNAPLEKAQAEYAALAAHDEKKGEPQGAIESASSPAIQKEQPQKIRVASLPAVFVGAPKPELKKVLSHATAREKPWDEMTLPEKDKLSEQIGSTLCPSVKKRPWWVTQGMINYWLSGLHSIAELRASILSHCSEAVASIKERGQ